ncbi:unnamed protein product [Rhodiola kirilowii]
MAIGTVTLLSPPFISSLCAPEKIRKSAVRLTGGYPVNFLQSSSIVDSLRFSKSTLLSRRSAMFKIFTSSSSSSSASGVSDDIGHELGEIEIFTANGESVKFKELWDQEEGVAVVALMRHFGCICCWELASTLKEAKPRFDAAGVNLIAVGVGPPNKAQILAERLPFPMDCLYADPDRKAYNLLNLYHGFGRTFLNPASAKVFSRKESFKKASENYTIKASPNNLSSILQQGGMFVFKGKQLLYARMDEGTGDHAPLDDVFEACCKIPVT